MHRRTRWVLSGLAVPLVILTGYGAVGAELETALEEVGFTVTRPAPTDIAGTSIHNFVNKDADGAGRTARTHERPAHGAVSDQRRTGLAPRADVRRRGPEGVRLTRPTPSRLLIHDQSPPHPVRTGPA